MSNFSYGNDSFLNTIKNNKIPAFIILAIALGLIGFSFLGFGNSKDQDIPTAITELTGPSEITRGNKDSNVTLIIYKDPQCNGCQEFAKNSGDKLDEVKDKIKIVYKYLQINGGHTKAPKFNRYIYAAEKLKGVGKELADKIYKETNLSPDDAQVLSFAESLGVSDRNELSKVANSDEIEKLVKKQGKDLGFLIPKIEGLTSQPTSIGATPGLMLIKDNKTINLSASDRNFTNFEKDAKPINSANMIEEIKKLL
ncbi:MAG: DsbA family protein [Patescibacteria group bacterium]